MLAHARFGALLLIGEIELELPKAVELAPVLGDGMLQLAPSLYMARLVLAQAQKARVQIVACLIGAPPPTVTPPTWICLVFRRVIIPPSYLKILNASIRTRSL